MHVGDLSRPQGNARKPGSAVARLLFVLAVASLGLAWLAWPHPTTPAAPGPAVAVASVPAERPPAASPAKQQASLPAPAPTTPQPSQAALPPAAIPPAAAAAPAARVEAPLPRLASAGSEIPFAATPVASVAPRATGATGATGAAAAPPAEPAPLAGPAPRADAAAPAREAAAKEAPAVKEAALSKTAALDAAAPNRLVDLNSASVAELNALRGTGPIGRAIVRGRPYASAEDLVTKRVVRRPVYERIKDQVTVR